MEPNPLPGIPPPQDQEPVQPPITQPPAPIVPETLDKSAPSSAPTDHAPHTNANPQVFLPSFGEQNVERPLGVAETPVNGPVTGQVIGFNDTEISKPRRLINLNKRIAIPVLAVFVLLGGSAAAYFGYYVPNKPENMWKTALSRTGKGYDKLSDYTVNLAKSSGHGETFSGSAKFSGGLNLDASFQGTTDGANSQTTGSLSYSGVKATLDLRTLKSSSSTPDIYFKVDGLQGLGQLLGADSVYASALNNLNGNWYFIDHSLIDQYTSQVDSGSTDQFSANDLKNLLSAVGTPTKTYVFNPTSDNAVLVVKQQVGREKQDGRNVYHYKIGVDKANLKDYNNALCDSLKDNKIFKLLSGSDPSALNDCKDTSDLDNIKDSDSVDVWVDTHTKLIHRVRFPMDGSGSKSNLDVGQDYQGGDEIPFFVDINSSSQESSSKFHIDINLNTKTNKLSVDGKLNAKGRTADDSENGEIKFNLQPRSASLKVEKPSGSKTFLELLDSLGLGDLLGSDGGSPLGVEPGSGSNDTERKTDITALQGHLEAYYADNAFYPTLAELNDANWVAANFKGLDTGALQDPAGASKKIASAPAAHVYAYQVSPAGCDNLTKQCQSYTLTATLDSGGTFVKKSFNDQPV